MAPDSGPAPVETAAAPLAARMETRIARYATRSYDWDALKFQAEFDPKYRRAQMRYMGTGGTGVDSDANTVPSEHFTFSTMVLPPGCEGPLHVHDDADDQRFWKEERKMFRPALKESVSDVMEWILPYRMENPGCFLEMFSWKRIMEMPTVAPE